MDDYIQAKGEIIEGLPSNIYHKCVDCGGNMFQYMDDWSKLSPDEMVKKEQEQKIYLQCTNCKYPTHD